MHPAPLPACPLEHGRYRLLQAFVGVADDQLHAAQAGELLREGGFTYADGSALPDQIAWTWKAGLNLRFGRH